MASKKQWADIVTIVENAQHKGIELHFNASPHPELQSKLRAVGYRPSRVPTIWYAEDNAASRDFSERLRIVFAEHPEGPTLQLSPSFEPVKANIEKKDFSYVVISLRNGTTRNYIIFEPSKPKAEVIAHAFARVKFGDEFLALAIKPRTNLREARILLEEGKVILANSHSKEAAEFKDEVIDAKDNAEGLEEEKLVTEHYQIPEEKVVPPGQSWYTAEQATNIRTLFVEKGLFVPFTVEESFQNDLPVYDLAFRYQHVREYFQRTIQTPATEKINKLEEKLNALKGEVDADAKAERLMLQEQIASIARELNWIENLITEEDLVFKDEFFSHALELILSKGFELPSGNDLEALRGELLESIFDNRAIENYPREPVSKITNQFIQEYFSREPLASQQRDKDKAPWELTRFEYQQKALHYFKKTGRFLPELEEFLSKVNEISVIPDNKAEPELVKEFAGVFHQMSVSLALMRGKDVSPKVLKAYHSFKMDPLPRLQGGKIIEHSFIAFLDVWTSGNFQYFLQLVGLPEECKTCRDSRSNTSNIYYVWETKGLRMVTDHHPVKEYGRLIFFLGLQGLKAQVEEAVRIIHFFTGSWGNPELDVVRFEWLHCIDPPIEGPDEETEISDRTTNQDSVQRGTELKPWQISRKDYEKKVIEHFRKTGKLPGELKAAIQNHASLQKLIDLNQPDEEQIRRIAGILHQTSVSNAILENYKLPESAREDYPWLFAKNLETKKNKKLYAYSLKKADLGSEENFSKLLRYHQINEQWKKCSSPKEPGQILYVWEGDTLRLVTTNNPLLEKGYISFIGLEGSKETVTGIVDTLKKITDAQGEEGLGTLSFDDLICIDPSQDEPEKPIDDPRIDSTNDSPVTNPESKTPESNESRDKDESGIEENKKDAVAKTDQLKKFSAFLSDHDTINEDTDEGRAKVTFGRLGKKAFKELAVFLGLNEFDVSYNKAGAASSGDLRLMGMFSEGKGIYITLSKDGISDGILYRAIKHMKDFSGGANHYFEEREFATPHTIKEKIISLLDLKESGEKVLAQPTTKPSDDVTKEKGFIENQAKEITTEPSATTLKELYNQIEEGEQMERLPELAAKMFSPEFKGEIKLWRLSLYDLIREEKFRAKVNINLWKIIPDEYKTLKAIKPLAWQADPKDPGLRKLMEDFVGTNQLVSKLLGANFDGQGITATDSHKLLFLNKTNPAKKGIYCLTKFCFKTLGKEGEEEAVIQESFPDYVAVIPKKINAIRTVNVAILRQFCYALLKDNFVDSNHKGALFRYENHYIGINLKYLQICAETFLRLGYRIAEMGFIAFNKPILIAPYDEMAEVSAFNTQFILLMPQLGSFASEEPKPERGEIYFDLNDYTIVTEGIDEKISLFPKKSAIPAAEEISEVETTRDHSKEVNEDYLDRVVAWMHDKYAKDERPTKKQIENLADTLGVPNMGRMWEAAELSWMLWYKKLYKEKTSFESRLMKMIEFWNKVQPTYIYSDSSKEIYKQYSTPCPIAAIVAQYTRMDEAQSIFEPSAGNGLLVLGADPKKTHVNEIDHTRLDSLKFQGYKKITTYNAAQPFPDEMTKAYDVVVTNPPFTRWEEEKFDKDFLIRKYFDNHIGLAKYLRLEHVMAGLALHTMKDNGRAAIIIMGHMYFGDDGYIAKYRPFFNWLYRHYKVDDVINLNSFKLYNKQGAIEKTMLILVGGRKVIPQGVAPRKAEAPQLQELVNSFEELWNRVKKHTGYTLEIIIEQLKLALAA
jgi:hypothetical protein